MTDGNTYEINKRLNDQEDWDALQEVTTELEQAEARIEELEAKLAAKEKLMLALAGDNIDLVSELAGVKGKLAKAREDALREAADHISHHGSRNDIYSKSRSDAASAILSLIEQETPNE